MDIPIVQNASSSHFPVVLSNKKLRRMRTSSRRLYLVLSTCLFLALLQQYALYPHMSVSKLKTRGLFLKTPSTAPKEKPLLDFFVAGFAKCGTTSLLSLFDGMSETSMAPQEICIPFGSKLSDDESRDLLNETVAKMPGRKKRGIKCPGGIRMQNAIRRMQMFAPEAKWIIGIRHPVRMMESYYNYRIHEMHMRNETVGNIPQIESLTSLSSEWKGVSTDLTRYEMFLMQMGKTDISTEELRQYANHTNPRMKVLNVVPNNTVQLFLYTVEQLDADNGESRRHNRKFRRGLQNFLGLRSAIPSVPRSNAVRETHPESINICNPIYNNLRGLLVRQASVTAKWILEEFLQHPDVTVANQEHFVALLSRWDQDPCKTLEYSTA